MRLCFLLCYLLAAQHRNLRAYFGPIGVLRGVYLTHRIRAHLSQPIIIGAANL